MKIPGMKTAKMYSRWLRGRISGGALILGYHRIAHANHDEFGNCVTPTHFKEHLEFLQKYTHPLSLSELVQHLNHGTLPRKSIALTLDDGYADNLHHARPLLEQFQIPATVFISTDYLGGTFWWDKLESLVMGSPTYLPSFQIIINGVGYDWNSVLPRVKLGNIEDNLLRKMRLKSLYFKLLPLEKDEREDVISQIEHFTGNQLFDASVQRALTIAELLEISKGELIDIGAHSKTHPILSLQNAEVQKEEILHSKEFLEELLEEHVQGFAYPNGKFSEETQAIVREAGYLYACSSDRELVWQGQQCYALPRIWPQDWDGDQFARAIKFWLGS